MEEKKMIQPSREAEDKMITFRVSAHVENDRRVLITLPPEVPIGRNELTVNVTTPSPDSSSQSRFSLADWSDQCAEHWGNRLNAADVESFTGRGV
jgi:hypothetical protein